MADVDLGSDGGGKKGGVKKAKKLSTRVDLTPMVDLGFLLLTFFVFSSTMSQPASMNMNMPDDRAKDKEQNEAAASGALTILLGNDHTVYYYEGTLAANGANVKESNFQDIRDVIVNKKKSTPKDDFVVVLMPGDASTYADVVKILNEMSINLVETYALVAISPENAAVLKAKGH